MNKYSLTLTKSKGRVTRVRGAVHAISYKKDDTWIVYSYHLRLFGYSNDTEEKALEDFNKALDLFFTVHSKLGSLEKALNSFGWGKIKYKQKQFDSPEIPIDLLSRGKEFQISIAA